MKDEILKRLVNDTAKYVCDHLEKGIEKYNKTGDTSGLQIDMTDFVQRKRDEYFMDSFDIRFWLFAEKYILHTASQLISVIKGEQKML